MERSSFSESSSKVTVECIDPFELFATFESLLSERLPLRTLHWKSTDRPLRSIDTLHVNLVPVKDGGDQGPPVPERRHQIPGLWQTPYLKIFLLRCDDNETYKATCRKQMKDWVKNNAFTRDHKKGSSNQENHDACQWLIVHLVLTDTPVAAQVRAAREAQLGTTDSSDSLSTKARFLTKGPSSVLEKLRTDFNSSKSSIDRVAQIRLPRPDHQLSADYKDQIQDLVEKLEVTILTSFDLRVQQYEEDIRERDSRRGLPGWNFNTFFILKEGLARGFENVGLFEDALAGYDELALGLEAVIQEQIDGEAAGHGGNLVHFNEELKDKIHACLKDADDSFAAKNVPDFNYPADPADRLQRRDFLVDVSRGPFRELILANEISIFDFRLYIISRQLNLLLRMANASSITDPKLAPKSGRSKHKEQYLPLSKVCKRAAEFIANAARTLQHDLGLALDMKKPMSADELDFRSITISNFVLSWVYVATLQILAQTNSPDLSLPSSADLPSPNHISGLASSSQHSTPQRSSTFYPRTPGSVSINGPRSSLPSATNPRTGAEELTGARAELYLLARDAVERVGIRHGALTHNSSAIAVAAPGDESRKSRNKPMLAQSNGELPRKCHRSMINGLQHLDLRSVFHSEDAFMSLFTSLTTFSYQNFLAANRTNSAERMLAEMALLKFDAGSYEVAALYLSRLCSFYSESQWNVLGATYLELYAKCLKQLGRHEEYVSVLLRLLGQTEVFQRLSIASAIDEYLSEMWLHSDKLKTLLYAKMSDFFSISGLVPNIRHFDDRDGFYITFDLGFRLGSLDIAGGLEVTLTSATESSVRTITLSTDAIRLDCVACKIEAKSNVNTSGWYLLDRMQIKIGNLVFCEDYKTINASSRPKDYSQSTSHTSLRYFLYPPKDSLQAVASPAPYLQLAQSRSILIELHLGWNQIQECTLSLRSETPGLRLRLHDAELEDGGDPGASSHAGTREGVQVINFSNCAAQSTHSLLVPYTSENADVPIINARLHLEYTTPNGHFVYSCLVVVNTILPISVNVQDIFKQAALVSRLTIGPATLVPLRLWSCDLQDSDGHFHIGSHEGVQDSMDVFPRQPASLLYQISRRQGRSGLQSQQGSLRLVVKFSCVDEVAANTVKKLFTSLVADSAVGKLIHPLLDHLLTTLRSQWSSQDLEVIALCREIEIRPFEDLNWEAVLIGFDLVSRRLARTWLRKWHDDHAIITIYEGSQKMIDVPIRSIVVPVDIPAPPIVATVSLELDMGRHGAVVLGEVVLAELNLSTTRSWSAPNSTSDVGKEELELTFEVMTSAENWVVGGTRKGHVLIPPATAKEPIHSIPLVLLPQRTGHLLLPAIEVRCYKLMKSTTTTVTAAAAADGAVPCEVDNVTLAKSVHVVSGLRETVVDIDVEAEAGGRSEGEKRSWLVDSKVRDSTVYTDF